jgi:hypothetical protein
MSTLITGSENIRHAQRLAQKWALKMELKGMKRKGSSMYSMIKAYYGLKGNKQKVYDQFCEIVERMDPKRIETLLAKYVAYWDGRDDNAMMLTDCVNAFLESKGKDFSKKVSSDEFVALEAAIIRHHGNSTIRYIDDLVDGNELRG